MSLIDNHLEALHLKYSVIVDVLLVLDEWIYLTTSRRFFEDPETRTTFRRYSLMIKTCKTN